MKVPFFKYQGAGNDFVMIDNRSQQYQFSTQQIQQLCDRHFGIGSDGLILLENSSTADFKMIYFNSDGRESTMCGNGGRCIVAFAKYLSLITRTTTFEAIDGMHYAEVIKDNYIRLQMKDVSSVERYNNDFVLNTGSPHYVKVVENVNTINVYEEGRKIRYSEPFKAQGINVNFLQIVDENTIIVRTYERGVENETLSCGTGVTASAIVASILFNKPKYSVSVSTKGGTLQVDFELKNNTYQNVFLSGNAEYVFNGEIKI
jgi:diaminopimelate epimerase